MLSRAKFRYLSGKNVILAILFTVICTSAFGELWQTQTMNSSLFSDLKDACVNSLTAFDGRDGIMTWNNYKLNYPGYEKGQTILGRDILWEYWYNPFGADGYNVRPHMAVCSDGGFAVTGYYIIEDGMGGYIEWQGYVMKISSEGELLWADPDTLDFMGENESWAVIETSDGGLINCGDGYMIKRDSNGNRLWSQDLNIAPHTMCYSHYGNTILSGGTPNGDCLFREIDEDGNELLNNDIELAHSASIRRIIPTSDEGYAMTGIILESQGWSFDILIIKTNSLGDTLWTYTKGGNGNRRN